MTRTPEVARGWTTRDWAPFVGTWAAAAVITTALFYAGSVAERAQPKPVLATLLAEAVGWGFWLLSVPVVARISSRFPVQSSNWLRRLGIHAIAAVTLVSAQLGLLVVVDIAFGLSPAHGREQAMMTWIRLLAYRSTPEVFIYASIVVSFQLIFARRLLHTRAISEARLQAELSEARLRALRAQIHPHFLFNTLNSAVTLVRDVQTEQAQQVLIDLAALLRAELDDWDTPEHTIADELHLVERYLAIERTRFTSRLRFAFDVSPQCLPCVVPRFVLQPLVENAIRHAVERGEHGGTIAIGVQGANGSVVMWVEDDGPGLPKDWRGALQPGTGLRNISARLTELYGVDGELTLSAATRSAGGVRATLKLPWRCVSSATVR